MIKRLTILLFLSASAAIYAQTDEHSNPYRIEGDNVVLYLDGNTARHTQVAILAQYGMKGLSLDTLWNFGSLGVWGKQGWKLERWNSNGYRIYKSLTDLSGKLKFTKEVVIFNDYWERIRLQTTAVFGFNSFQRETVRRQKNGTTRFFIPGNLASRDAFLSGTFNGWSLLSNPMTKTDSGWVAEVILKPGKHCYKFILGGRWIHDTENNHREDDYHQGYNSVYFVTNYEFKLNGYTNARKVFLSGSFNDWNRREVPMQKTKTGWRIPVYLNEGTHAYKFIVDGDWVLDPANPDVRDDGKGNNNSYVKLGESFSFKLDGHLTAKRVIIAGEFNGWNEKELIMNRTASGWELAYALGPGNYQYKFIVDGEWMIDPDNPTMGRIDGHLNSVVVVKPNQTFRVKGFENARAVQIAGNFNGWSGYTMKKSGKDWVIDLHIPMGKCLYKIIVDGVWMIDPGNKLWEQNEYGNGNSVLWKTEAN